MHLSPFSRFLPHVQKERERERERENINLTTRNTYNYIGDVLPKKQKKTKKNANVEARREERRAEQRKEANEIMINIAYNAFLLVLAWRRCCSLSSLYQNRQQTKESGKEKQTEAAAERLFDLIVQGHLSSSFSHLFLCSLHDDDDEKSRREAIDRVISLLSYPSSSSIANVRTSQ